MKIMITGGAGFIGSHVADIYIENGHDVFIVDSLVDGRVENINPKAKFYLLDIRSKLLEKIIEMEKPDIINHHAAQISVPNSVKDPIYDSEVNVLGFLNVLENSIKYNVKKVIFISSGGAIYGEAEEYPTSENYFPKPLSPYAINKYVSENYLYFYYKQHGLNYTVLRYANIYGPRQIPHGEAGVVSIFIEKLLKNEVPTIYAYEDEPDGMVRDYVYVKDVAKANILAIDKGDGEAINICTQEETSTGKLYKEICKVMDKNINPTEAGPRPGDLKHSCLINDKAKRVLGWEPSTSLFDGLKETYQYFNNQNKK